jgi:hypothetical protein
MANQKNGKDNSNWNGGRFIQNGYVMIYVGNGKYKQEHVLVMEKQLGRKLLPGEIVHHKDESFEARSNNDPSNLELTNKSDHTRHHNEKRVYKKGYGKGYNICFNRLQNKYQLLIYDVNGKRRSSGYYDTKEDALQFVEDMYCE